ncbi:hypothetical protein DFP72DRAFT_307114 [Ephemerocybe angulata]|uniref:Uncharacterized protein n=1 Tax=Ephemerocybe angulata TaxID=980116 RepID=A0A8H6I153_9AGAR|nr:hypothetical protein DFP72DRAFT_307114 [Tulosesus angulatus]
MYGLHAALPLYLYFTVFLFNLSFKQADFIPIRDIRPHRKGFVQASPSLDLLRTDAYQDAAINRALRTPRYIGPRILPCRHPLWLH